MWAWFAVATAAATVCMCAGQTLETAFVDAPEAMETVRSLQDELGVSFALAGEWEPFYAHIEQAWQFKWWAPGAFHSARTSVEWERDWHTFDVRWDTYALTVYMYIANPRELAYETIDGDYANYWHNIEREFSHGFGLGGPGTEANIVPATEPRLFLGEWPSPHPVLGTIYREHTSATARGQCWTPNVGEGYGSPHLWHLLRTSFLTTPATGPPSGRPTVQIPRVAQDRFLAPLALATKGRSAAARAADTCSVELQTSTCHDGHFGAPRDLLAQELWDVPEADWGKQPMSPHAMVNGARYPGTPLVSFIAPRRARLVVSTARPWKDYGRDYWNLDDSTGELGFNWEGYIVRAQESVLLTCACSFPQWTSGVGCRTLVCGADAADVPPDQFWPYCPHTLRRMCGANPVTRRACGPAYDGGTGASARGVHNPFRNIWSCECDTAWWDAHPLALGFALQEAEPGVGIHGTVEPLCLGGPPCSRMVFCGDHVDTPAGWHPETHEPLGWVNFVGDGNHTVCNGHGTCGDHGVVTTMTNGSQVAGWCKCSGNYAGPGCSRCDTENGWWGYETGCGRTCMSRGRVCHGAGSCDSFSACTCSESSHRDPATMCATCLLGYLPDPGTCPESPPGSGIRDTGHPDCGCIATAECIDADSGVVCAGHGTCVTETYNIAIPQRCLCDTGWSGFTCAVSVQHCLGLPANRPCLFPDQHQRCKRTRLFLMPPDPGQDIRTAVADLPPAFLERAVSEAGINLTALADAAVPGATVAAAWPSSSRALNRLACASWVGATPATPQDWETGSSHTRGAVLLAAVGTTLEPPRYMVLGDGLAYASLATGRLRRATPTETASGVATGPALCIRDSCQIDVSQCHRIAVQEACSGHERVRVLPVKMGHVDSHTAVRLCRRYGMVPLIQSHVTWGTGRGRRGRPADSFEFETKFVAAMHTILGEGSYRRTHTAEYMSDYGPRQYFTNTPYAFVTTSFNSAAEPDGVHLRALHNFKYFRYDNQWKARSFRGILPTYGGWAFVPCSQHCFARDMWGPDPDCMAVVGGG